MTNNSFDRTMTYGNFDSHLQGAHMHVLGTSYPSMRSFNLIHVYIGGNDIRICTAFF